VKPLFLLKNLSKSHAMKNSQPIFIISSGRAGSAMMEKALGQYHLLDMHHEYCCTHVQKVAVQHYMGLTSAADVTTMIDAVYAPALHLSNKPFWGDSSNKLSWIIPELAARFPSAKFVHVVRDGRKVASSYLHKLGNECYDDAATKALADYVRDPATHPAPPPEKRYWWPQPQASHPFAKRFHFLDQFQRIAFHWSEINQVITASLAALPATQSHFVRLEDLCAEPGAIRGVTDFLGFAPRDDLFGLFQRPHNVNRPQDNPLTPDQAAQFEDLAGDMMEKFGYAGTPEYRVAY